MEQDSSIHDTSTRVVHLDACDWFYSEQDIPSGLLVMANKVLGADYLKSAGLDQHLSNLGFAGA